MNNLKSNNVSDVDIINEAYDTTLLYEGWLSWLMKGLGKFSGPIGWAWTVYDIATMAYDWYKESATIDPKEEISKKRKNNIPSPAAVLPFASSITTQPATPDNYKTYKSKIPTPKEAGFFSNPIVQVALGVLGVIIAGVGIKKYITPLFKSSKTVKEIKSKTNNKHLTILLDKIDKLHISEKSKMDLILKLINGEKSLTKIAYNTQQLPTD